MELKDNKDRTLRWKDMPVAELKPWHHFWHNTYHRCIVYSVELTEGENFLVRFRPTNEEVIHEAVYPRDSAFTKVWNIKMNNNARYGHRKYRR
jgi:hypothetical protein